MTTVAHFHGARMQSAGQRRDRNPQDFDLPVLGAQEAPRVRLDWESMLEEGAQPSLILGAERRLRGPR